MVKKLQLTRWQGLSDLLRLFLVSNNKGVEKPAAADLHLGVILVSLDSDS